MLNRSSFVILVAIAALGTTALASGAAHASDPKYYRATSTVTTTSNAASHFTPNTIYKVAPGANALKNNPTSGIVANSGNGNGNSNSGNGSTTPAFKYTKKIPIDCPPLTGCKHDPDGDHHGDHDGDHDRDHHYPWWFVDWHRPHVGVSGYEAVQVSAPAATVVTTPAAAPCNCLTKRYLDDGSVLFADLCTKEQAMATPDEIRAQAQNVAR